MKKQIGLALAVMLLLMPLSTAAANDFDLNIGFQYNLVNDEGEPIANTIGVNIKPDISIGNFGIGLIGSFRFSFGGDAGFTFIAEDWIPDFTDDENLIDKAQTVASTYLPLIRYVRYGFKGDPLYARFGELDSVTVGTGIFVNRYTNTALQPDIRLMGAQFDIDGELFGFPYIGFETFISDLSAYNLMAGRVYTRPLAFISFPLLHDIQVGASYATDLDPDAYGHFTDAAATAPDQVLMYGADIMMPVLDMGLFGLTLYGDLAFQQKDETPVKAYRTGLMGDIVGFIRYRADVTFPESGYQPDYFSKKYDLDRYQPYENSIAVDNLYLFANLGFDLFDENLVLDVSIMGDLDPTAGTIDTPSMEAYMKLGEDLLPFFYFDATYTRNELDGSSLDTFLDGVLNPMQDSVINANVTVKYSIIETSFGYTIAFDENGDMSTSGFSLAGDIALPF
ncbi:MAG: hypothetical protein K9M84_03010 [Spirochaetia bacterium]|nr:hypothetical protein [Spirochaetia bacterium]